MLTHSFHLHPKTVGRLLMSEPEQCLLHQFAEALGNAVDARDAKTFRHSEEVAVVSEILAEALGQPPDQKEWIHIAGHLHDIGKIGVPDAVLQKRGSLGGEEWVWMRRHPEIGAAIVRPVVAFARGGVADMILFHHERFDGTGYPCGLKGIEIPTGAQIIAVADALSAMLQDRPYRQRTSFDAACAEIWRCSGTQFDPTVVLAFESVREKVMAFFNHKAKIRGEAV